MKESSNNHTLEVAVHGWSTNKIGVLKHLAKFTGKPVPESRF